MAEIINIEKFIADNKWQQVTNPKMFDIDPVSKEPIPTKDGLFSYEIFGPKYTAARNTNWGYINLGVEIIHPVALDLMDLVSGAFRKIALRKVKYSLEDGMLVPDPDHGKWGVAFIKEVIDKIKWDKLSNYDNKIMYIKKLKQAHSNKSLYINKWIVEPAGFRDFNIKEGRVTYDDVNDLYRSLLATASESQINNKYANYLLGNKNKDQAVSKETIIQKYVSDIHQYFVDRLAGKGGLIRGAMIKKRTDFASRLVASALPEIPPLSATVPWGSLLNLFAPFVIHEIENNPEVKKMISSSDYISIDEYSNTFQYIFKNMSTVSKEKPKLKAKLIDILKNEIEKNNLKVNIKRDPAFGDVSHWVCYPIIDTRDVYNICMNSLYYSPIGGDSISGRTVIYYDMPLKINSNILEFENGVWGRFGSLDVHHRKFFS